VAESTPPKRNPWVAVLRAVSITIVVVGHWLIAVACDADGESTFDRLLKAQPQTHWLTWLFQVGPGRSGSSGRRQSGGSPGRTTLSH
jgi:uncharacterized membrane protein YgcG